MWVWRRNPFSRNIQIYWSIQAKPINQWYRYSFYDILDHSIVNNYSFENERYKGQEIIFGKDVQKKLEKLNIFVVGA